MPASETHDERVERLLIHSYDDRIEQRKTDRSMENTKLVDLYNERPVLDPEKIQENARGS